MTEQTEKPIHRYKLGDTVQVTTEYNFHNGRTGNIKELMQYKTTISYKIEIESVGQRQYFEHELTLVE